MAESTGPELDPTEKAPSPREAFDEKQLRETAMGSLKERMQKEAAGGVLSVLGVATHATAFNELAMMVKAGLGTAIGASAGREFGQQLGIKGYAAEHILKTQDALQQFEALYERFKRGEVEESDLATMRDELTERIKQEQAIARTEAQLKRYGTAVELKAYEAKDKGWGDSFKGFLQGSAKVLNPKNWLSAGKYVAEKIPEVTAGAGKALWSALQTKEGRKQLAKVGGKALWLSSPLISAMINPAYSFIFFSGVFATNAYERQQRFAAFKKEYERLQQGGQVILDAEPNERTKQLIERFELIENKKESPTDFLQSLGRDNATMEQLAAAAQKGASRGIFGGAILAASTYGILGYRLAHQDGHSTPEYASTNNRGAPGVEPRSNNSPPLQPGIESKGGATPTTGTGAPITGIEPKTTETGLEPRGSSGGIQEKPVVGTGVEPKKPGINIEQKSGHEGAKEIFSTHEQAPHKPEPWKLPSDLQQPMPEPHAHEPFNKIYEIHGKQFIKFDIDGDQRSDRGELFRVYSVDGHRYVDVPYADMNHDGIAEHLPKYEFVRLFLDKQSAAGGYYGLHMEQHGDNVHSIGRPVLAENKSSLIGGKPIKGWGFVPREGLMATLSDHPSSKDIPEIQVRLGKDGALIGNWHGIPIEFQGQKLPHDTLEQMKAATLPTAGRELERSVFQHAESELKPKQFVIDFHDQKATQHLAYVLTSKEAQQELPDGLAKSIRALPVHHRAEILTTYFMANPDSDKTLPGLQRTIEIASHSIHDPKEITRHLPGKEYSWPQIKKALDTAPASALDNGLREVDRFLGRYSGSMESMKVNFHEDTAYIRTVLHDGSVKLFKASLQPFLYLEASIKRNMP